MTTLKDLQTPKSTPSAYTEVSISDLKPTIKEENPTEKFLDEALGTIDTAIDRIAAESQKYVAEVKEKEAEAELEKELASEDTEEDLEVEVMTSEVVEEKKTITIAEKSERNALDFDPEDIADLDEEDDVEVKEEDTNKMDVIKGKIKERIKPVTDVIDIKSFTISSKPISISNALKPVEKAEAVDWVLPAAYRAFSMEEFRGLEIEDLNPANSSRNPLNTYKTIFTILYNHIVDANKPATMEQWVKTLRFADLQHIYFAVYMGSFKDVNFIPYDCPHCKEVFVSENVALEDMVKYSSEKIEKLMKELRNTDTTSESHDVEVELVQVSNDYLIGLKDPSVYGMIFENIMLDAAFTEKYANILALTVYIDSIYFIDRENNQLKPIEPKTYPENIIKNIKSKVVTFAKILRTLNSDQFYEFNACITKMETKHDEITYVLPKVTCAKCNKEIDDTPMSADNLLFTRHQLAGIANI